MFLRATVVALSAAALLPFVGGTASASCLDDAQARRLDEGYTQSPKSPYWDTPRGFGAYVDQSGTATVTVHGDALVSDTASWVVVDWPNYLTTHAENSVDVTADFVDCVAG